jgi:hypothetical protein
MNNKELYIGSILFKEYDKTEYLISDNLVELKRKILKKLISDLDNQQIIENSVDFIVDTDFYYDSIIEDNRQNIAEKVGDFSIDYIKLDLSFNNHNLTSFELENLN